MSVQYTAPEFEPMTFRTWASSLISEIYFCCVELFCPLDQGSRPTEWPYFSRNSFVNIDDAIIIAPLLL